MIYPGLPKAATPNDDLLESTWSDDVANDPKHRPQNPDRPSTTVRREWCRRPQEAHLADGDRYRRLSVEEIAIIQGFPPSWVDVEGVKENDRIAALGNAVAPPVAAALGKAIAKYHRFVNRTMIEICAGIGGLGSGFEFLKPIALVEMWDVACAILRAGKPWPPSCVFEGQLENFDFATHRGKVGLLCGGPPCQPWSQAGKQRGAQDLRDIMGSTPALVDATKPEVFLFENVPGLVMAKEHKAYFENLLNRLAEPKEGLSYGVAVGIFNAADYGVPQVRKRVFIVGFRDKSFKFASGVLKAAEVFATHHDPSKPAIGKKPWVTLREALVGIPTVEPWRCYNAKASEGKEFLVDAEEPVPEVDSSPPSSGLPPGIPKTDQAVDRITFLWPGYDKRIVFREGKWNFEPSPEMDRRRSLLLEEVMGKGKGPGGMVVVGDYVEGLEALAPFVQGSGKLIYYDSHRRDVLEKSAEPGYADSTWLSLAKGISEAAYRCLSVDGVFVLHADETSAHYGRTVLDAVFGREHHVTTFAWQKKYAPQNDFTKNTPTDAFDYLIVYSKCHRDLIPKVGLMVRPKDIIDDGDFRGCFTAGHKGARSGSEKTKYEVNAPPYHWEIVESSLPKGAHWFDKHSGVLWFREIEETGTFWIKARAVDAKGKTAEAKISFSVREKVRSTEHFEYPEKIWWLMSKDRGVKKSGPLRVLQEGILKGLKGEPYSLVLSATGGEPFAGEMKSPGKGRYWEFSPDTLIEAVAQACVYFGAKGTALPSIKHYHGRENAVVKMAVMNWLPWQEYGKSEDATRHLRDLAAQGIIDADVSAIAKPERLLYHLVRLFAPGDRDIVISMGDPNASMAAVALKAGCFSVHITGPTPEDLARWNNTAKKRIGTVLAKKDDGGINDPDLLKEFSQADPGPVGVYAISRTSVEFDSAGSIIRLVPTPGKESVADFYAGLVGCSRQWAGKPFYGRMDGKTAYVLDPEDILDHILVSRIAGENPPHGRVYIIYERSDIGEDEPLPPNVQILHAPYELIGKVGR